MMMRLFAILNLVMLILLGLTVMRDFDPEWKKYQREYNQRLLNVNQDDATRASIMNQPLLVQQVWIPEWNVADRCMTCHLGVENTSFKDAPQPFTTHKNADRHRFSQFGCTVCHQGQGRATTRLDAHFMEKLNDAVTEREIKRLGWEWPMLPIEYVESSCGRCHEAETLKEAPTIMAGAKLFQEKGCLGCHTVGDRGGKIGPELTEAGTKFYNAGGVTEQFKHVRFGYLLESLLQPKANDPNSVMPAFGFTNEQARQLVTYLLSLRDEEFKLPKFTIPREKPQQIAAAAAPTAAGAAGADPIKGGQHYQTYCASCHGVSGKGDGAAAAALNPKPANHADNATMSQRSDEDLFKVVKGGGPAVGKSPLMPGWGASLNDQQIRDVVAFMRTLHGGQAAKAAAPTGAAAPAAAQSAAAPAAPPAPQAAAAPATPASRGDAEKGRVSYQTYCASCHGAGGKGDGAAAAALNPKPANHADNATMSQRSDEDLFKVVKGGGASVGKSPLMPGWGGSLNDAQIWDVVAFMRTLHGGQAAKAAAPTGAAPPSPAPAAAAAEAQKAVAVTAAPPALQAAAPPAPEVAAAQAGAIRAAVSPAAAAPAAPASGGDAEKGRVSYQTYCASCHGAGGKGDGAAAAALNPKPANHADNATMSQRSDEDLFKVVKGGGASVGKSPLMPGWGGSLNDAQIWDVVAFIRTLHRGK
ncbi:MAG: c-type cytochrome [Candidatus Tectomicrobia bacterium]|nr:c-type cytochrome [Candidatus Tectomicrobia bacterium]